MIKNFIFILLMSTNIFATEMMNGYLFSGFSFGLEKGTTQETILRVDDGKYQGCHILGEGYLTNEKRVNVKLNNLSCCKDKYCYEFKLENSHLVDNDTFIGLKTKHFLPSNKTLRKLNELETFYQKINEVNQLNLVRIAKKGHWDVEAYKNVNIVLISEPTLIKKFLINQNPLNISNN